MPLETAQSVEYHNQITALKRKLKSCLDDISCLKALAIRVQTKPSEANQFLAQLALAADSRREFNEAWDRLVFIHIKLDQADDYPSESEKLMRQTFLEIYSSAKAVEISLRTEPPRPNPNTTHSCCNASHESKSAAALLERIKLPHFSGDVRTWARYRDTFSSLVDKDESLEPVTKLYLLRDSLMGEALSVVNRFDITEANYALAWRALTDTYENKRVLAAAYLERIFSHRMKPRPGLAEFQRFLSEVADNVSAFRALKLENTEDKILALAMLRTLDSETRHKFELNHIGTDFPTADSIVQFVRNKCQALKLSDTHRTCSSDSPYNTNATSSNHSSSPSTRYPARTSTKYNPRSFLASNSSSPRRSSPLRSSPQRRQSPRSKKRVPSKEHREPLACPFCKQGHILARCATFMGLSIDARQDFVSKWKGCHNCLNPEHTSQDCKSRWRCRFCNECHHSLLHRAPENQRAAADPIVNHNGHACCDTPEDASSQQIEVILGTARALVKDVYGRDNTVRLLLDSGSHRSFITHQCAQSLSLNIHQTHSQVSGLGGSTVAETLGIARLTLTSLHSKAKVKVTASVLKGKITSQLPPRPLPRSIVDQFQGLQLADRNFYLPQEVDILLGADVFDQLCTGSFLKPSPDCPSILPTIFGDVIMGSWSSSQQPCTSAFLCQSSDEISSQLEAFWKLEEPEPASRCSPDDVHCEEHFRKTYTRTPTGRYVVRLPFSANPSILGDNRETARRRFGSIESRLSTNKQLRQDYHSFMKEYEELGHLSKARSPVAYVIPHFGIIQQKLRVVFDASCKSDTLTSLNDILHSGPKLQCDIRDVLTGFRLFPVAITADIVKMYRQVLLHPDDRKFQHIFWRENPAQELLELELNTVTYGLAPSAFLALRTIHQLIQDEGHKFPLAVQRLTNRIYVDDIATGADAVDEARRLCVELIGLFSRGGFELSKWSSNLPTALPDGCTLSAQPLVPQPENFAAVKVLGLVWNPKEDSFSYVLHELPAGCPTKRIVLSIISRIFDPLGFLAPVVFLTKVFLQDLWRNNIDWDATLTPELLQRWANLIQGWQELRNVKIPRYTNSRHLPCRLIGFCDASSRGYAAVLYLQVEISSAEHQITLLAAKTKVAPAKYMSIARLELCGALLLAKLIKATNLPDVALSDTVAFTDSMVVLGWLGTTSHQLKIFEANRVSAINEIIPRSSWRHVRSEDNPADAASRGLLPQQIVDCALWWNGPPWLSHYRNLWPSALNPDQAIQIPISSLALITTPTKLPDISWMQRFSSLSRLVRVVAWILRATRKSDVRCSSAVPLSASELIRATNICARSAQQAHLPKGIASPELGALSPFSDDLGILRVGGRLNHAPIAFPSKHPIIIPKVAHLAKLIVWDIHATYFHAGPTLTVSILRTKYWIPSAMRFVKGIISKCTICFRRKPPAHQTVMSPLPSSRFVPGRPFLQTGVDYAGPFSIRDTLRRKPVLTKAYVCLFICFATKAIHLEAVTSLTTEAFLAALDRFIARRGKPNTLHSDNATNFVGAARYLKDLVTFLDAQKDDIASYFSRQGIVWRFIPPRAPHFGGLWEAGVKSMKSLLMSSVSSQPLTFEEFYTLLARVESVLNSRPLCPISDDPDSFEPLTPGHFLIGSQPCSLPEENLEDLNTARLSRWQLVQRHVQHLWKRWRLEYLNTLQQRSKWRKPGRNICINDLVVLLDKTTPCGSWPLARVSATHPGPDGTVRVVTVRTPNGAELKRAIHRLAPLPLSESNPE